MILIMCFALTAGCKKENTDPDGSTELTSGNLPDPEWKSISAFPADGRSRPISFSIAGKGYAGLGFNTIDTYNSPTLKDFYCYDPLTDKWSTKSSPPIPDRKYTPNYTSVVIGDKAYLWYSQNLTLYVYKPASDIWTSHIINVPLENREVSSAFAIGTKGYFFSSYGGTIWEMDSESKSFTRKKDFPSGGSPYGWYTAFDMGGKGYVIYGTNVKVQIWEYNNTEDSWIQRAEIFKPFDHVAYLYKFDSKVYFGVGTSFTVSDLTNTATVLQHNLSKAIWCFNPANNLVGNAVDFGGTIRSGSGYFTISDKGYVIGGVTVNSNNKFDYLTDCWVFGRK